jgi:hypothetical protein
LPGAVDEAVEGAAVEEGAVGAAGLPHLRALVVLRVVRDLEAALDQADRT